MAPREAHEGIALSGRTRQKLGLDTKRQWIIVPELNVFDWPGYELRPTPLGDALYGFMPDPIVDELRARIVQLQRDGRLRPVTR